LGVDHIPVKVAAALEIDGFGIADRAEVDRVDAV
jgi:hypothetical protein